MNCPKCATPDLSVVLDPQAASVAFTLRCGACGYAANGSAGYSEGQTDDDAVDMVVDVVADL